MSKRKQLHRYGVALLLVAVCNLVILVLNIIAGDFDLLTYEDALVQDVANAIIITVLSCTALSILVGGYLGIKGILEAKKISGRSVHIVVARAVAVINLILAVIMGLALLGSRNLGDDFSSFVFCFVDTIIMYEYAKIARAVKNGEE